jgi:hypothetical protein
LRESVYFQKMGCSVSTEGWKRATQLESLLSLKLLNMKWLFSLLTWELKIWLSELCLWK